MKRRLVRALLVAVVLLGATAVWLWTSLAPPAIAVPPRGSLALSDVTVVNPGRGRAPQQTIRVVEGKIVSVEPSRVGEEAVRRFAGDFALPGLIDMHVHHPPATLWGDVPLFSLLFLAHGVTTVRDTGNMDGKIFATRRRIRDGEFPGPRIFACGPILDGAPPFWSGSRVVRDAAEGRSAVESLAAQGVDCIKVYDGISADALAGIREEAAQRGLHVIGHVPLDIPFGEAHLDDVQYLTGVKIREEKLTPARLRAIVTLSAALGIAHTPTLVLWDRAAQLADPAALKRDDAVRLLPRYYREVLWDPENDPRYRGLSAERWQEIQEAPPAAHELVRQLHEAKVRVFAGTDTMTPFMVPGASLHEELRALVDTGFTPEEAWSAATWQPGEFLGEPLLGRLQAGAPADFLIFRDDPTRDLAALDTLEAVVADGRLYPKAVLDAAVARWKKHALDPVFDAVTMRVAHWLTPGSSG